LPAPALPELEMTPSLMQLDDGSSLELDDKGYLLEPDAWTPAVAEQMAAADGIALSPDHWVILEFFREYHARFDIEPPMRALVRSAKERLGEEKGSSRYLYRLFPAGPATQACRYAGLPRPVSCI